MARRAGLVATGLIQHQRHPGIVAAISGQGQHWDDTYRQRGAAEVSWYQPQAATSVELVRLLGVEGPAPVVDVGGGSSPFARDLLALGFTDISVLDLSSVALEVARRQLGADRAAVTWLHQDVLAWQPARRYALWHDRALFHFLTGCRDRERYLAVLRQATGPGSGAIIATFAEDGSEQCSGLPVARYSSDALAEALGEEFSVVGTRRETHHTPAGGLQPFTWVAAKKVNEAPGAGPARPQPQVRRTATRAPGPAVGEDDVTS